MNQKTQKRRWCRVCRKERSTLPGGHQCNSCGTPTTEMRPAAMHSTAPRCPQCRHGGKMQPDGRHYCQKCDVWYEADDFGFVDDRPDVNAEKNEARAIRIAQAKLLRQKAKRP
jgi:hypothetical protein